jgi:hypothetical protein
MELSGHIENGQVVFDNGIVPPEGTRVIVQVAATTGREHAQNSPGAFVARATWTGDWMRCGIAA